MFEAVFADSNDSNTHRKQKQLQRLLTKYIELKKFQEINQSSNLSEEQRSKINKTSNKRRILKRLRNELNKRLKPEETYEVWHELDNINSNLKRFEAKGKVDGHLFDSVQDGEGGENDDDNDTNDNDKAIIEERLNFKAEEQLEKFTNTFDSSNTWTKANFFIRTRGLEVLPIPDEHVGSKRAYSTMKGHVGNLNTLLHLNLLRENWDLSYKLFCTLIRIPIVDIRSIWSIGIEILYRVSKENDEKLFLMKDEKFFDWLSSLLVINDTSVNSSTKKSRNISAPIWRSGSKTHTPLYIITSLWNLFTKKNITKLKDKLENLLLEPPYNTDGVFYYLMTLCVLVECVDLVNDIKETVAMNESNIKKIEGNKLKLLELLKMVEIYLSKCKELEFSYPASLISTEVTSLSKYAGNSPQSDISSDSELSTEEIISQRTASYPIEIGNLSSDEYSSDSSDSEKLSNKTIHSGSGNAVDTIPNSNQMIAFDFEID